MSEIKLKPICCPCCGEELEVIDDGQYYAHKINGCILQHLCFRADEEESIRLWNTRKPMERIVKRLTKELKLADKEKARCIRENPLQFDSAKGYAMGVYNAIEIVKEDGGV